MSKALVIGGTGKVGGALVERLVRAEHPVISASRSGKAIDGAKGVAFDWFTPDGHDAALTDVDRVFMIAPIGASDPIQVMGPFIERAIAAGVQRFSLLSASPIEEGGPATGAVHAMLRRQAPEWAVLRPTWFMENFVGDPHLQSIRFENVIYSATGNGRVPFISTRDIAEVAFRTLTDGIPLNDEVVLTGADLLSYEQVAAIIGDARGASVRHHELSISELAARLAGLGVPVPFASMLANLDGAIAAGAENRLTDGVSRRTAQTPIRFQDFASQKASVWSTMTKPSL